MCVCACGEVGSLFLALPPTSAYAHVCFGGPSRVLKRSFISLEAQGHIPGKGRGPSSGAGSGSCQPKAPHSICGISRWGEDLFKTAAVGMWTMRSVFSCTWQSHGLETAGVENLERGLKVVYKAVVSPHFGAVTPSPKNKVRDRGPTT